MAEPSTLEVLRRARELIRDESCWTQDTDARDADGKPCSFEAPAAHSWCALGAIWCIAGDNIGPIVDDAERALFGTGWEYIANWNDSADRTHEEVLEAFDCAIARLEEERHG